MQIPNEPIVLQKRSNKVMEPYDPRLIPRSSEKNDWK